SPADALEEGEDATDDLHVLEGAEAATAQHPTGATPDQKPVAPSSIALKQTKTGTPRPVIFNILEILGKDPEWTGVFGYDEFAGVATLLQHPPYLAEAGPWEKRPIEDPDDTETSNWLQREYDLFAPTSLVAEGVQTLARRHPYHPIRDYLVGLTWDGAA